MICRRNKVILTEASRLISVFLIVCSRQQDCKYLEQKWREPAGRQPSAMRKVTGPAGS